MPNLRASAQGFVVVGEPQPKGSRMFAIRAALFSILLVAGASAALARPAPNFAATDLSGRPVSLAQLHGKVVLLDLWASWCAPCVAGLPKLLTIESRLRRSGFVIVGVALDNADAADRNAEAKLRRFVRAHRIDFPIVQLTPAFNADYGRVLGLKDGKIVAHGLIAASLPSWILIGRDGTIRAIYKSSSQEQQMLTTAARLAH